MEIWEQHSQLYHYTGISGLKGILDSQSLHATHYQFVNDITEMYAVRPKLVSLARDGLLRGYDFHAKDPKKLAHMEANGGKDVLVGHDADIFVNSLYRVTLGTALPFRHFEPHIVSFCGHTGEYESANGLLSQWRGYGRTEAYAIVFDCKRLVDLLAHECDRYFYSSAHLGSVVYEGDDKTFSEEFSELEKSIKALTEKLIINPKDVEIGLLLPPLLSCISRYKQIGFQEEQEVRLVASPMEKRFIEHMTTEDAEFTKKNKDKQLKIQDFRSDLSPYISISASNTSLPIRKIIVGPGASQLARSKALKKYVEVKGLKIDVSCSQTPLADN